MNFISKHFVKEKPHVGVCDVTEERDVEEGKSVGPQARAGRPHLAVHQDSGDVRRRGPEVALRGRP